MAVRTLGGSGANREIFEQVLRAENLRDEQQEIIHGDGPQTEIEYRLAWARTYLKGMGLLHNSSRAVWSLTDAGHTVTEQELPSLRQSYDERRRKERRRKRREQVDGRQPDASAESDAWRDELLEALLRTPPHAFERLAQRLLREAGFISVTVTSRTSDGGIDGAGVCQVSSLLSFPVFFQCKRYRGGVGASAIRDFRGAMVGRGDKGLLITTGSFTPAATMEATRDGAPPIDLIDGHRLCDLLKQYELGVHTTVPQVEEVTIDTEFFE